MSDLVVKIDGADALRLQFRRFQEGVSDPRDVYEDVAGWFRTEEQKIFRSQGREYPPKWAALSPAYAARKMAEVGRKPILEYTGALKKSLTERPFAIEFITKRAATFGTDIPYATYHQRGTPFMPARPPLVKATNKSQRKLQRIIQSALVDNWK